MRSKSRRSVESETVKVLMLLSYLEFVLGELGDTKKRRTCLLGRKMRFSTNCIISKLGRTAKGPPIRTLVTPFDAPRKNRQIRVVHPCYKSLLKVHMSYSRLSRRVFIEYGGHV